MASYTTARQELIAETEERMSGIVDCGSCGGTGCGPHNGSCGTCFGNGKLKRIGNGYYTSTGEEYVGEFPG